MDLMVDIETLGTESNSAILTIGAVPFNLKTGKYDDLDSFFIAIDLDSCLKAGLKINASTLKWWMNRSEEARKIAFSGKESLVDALIEFKEYLSCRTIDTIWGNSASFDLGLLADAYNIINLKIPWTYRKERCVRTLAQFMPDIVKKIKEDSEEIAHDAIGDCINQINYTCAIYKNLNLK